MTKMINPNVMRAPPLSAQILGNQGGGVSPAVQTMSSRPAAAVMPQAATPVKIPQIAQSNAGVPQTGLIGSEQALMAGHNAAVGTLGQGYSQAQGYLQNMLGSLGTVGVPEYTPSLAQVTFGGGADVTDTLNSIKSGMDAGRANINTAFNEGVGALSGYNQGQGAMKMQADLSGANGLEAQQAAYAAYQSSPAMQYQMDQMQKATERSAAARGGLLGGNVLTELQRNASGIASQDYQNQFNNLGQVAQTGLGAASQIAGLKGNQAATEAGLVGTMAGIQGNLAGQKMGIEGNLAATALSGQNNLAAQSMAIRGNRENAILGIRADATNRLADLAQSAGLNTAGLYTGTAQQLSQGRTQAGQMIAQNANQAASNISNMLAQNGIAVSDMMAKDISTVTDMIYQSGMQEKIDSQQLAAILANIAGGQASTVAQGYSNIGAANAAGTLGIGNAVQNAIGQYIANSGTQAAPRATTTPKGGILGAGTGSQYGAYA